MKQSITVHSFIVIPCIEIELVNVALIQRQDYAISSLSAAHSYRLTFTCFLRDEKGYPDSLISMRSPIQQYPHQASFSRPTHLLKPPGRVRLAKLWRASQVRLKLKQQCASKIILNHPFPHSQFAPPTHRQPPLKALLFTNPTTPPLLSLLTSQPTTKCQSTATSPVRPPPLPPPILPFRPPILTLSPSEKVCIITTDGRTLVGTLAAYDNTTNLVLQNTIERIIRTPDDAEPSAQVPLGLYLIRGENVCTIGLVDEALDDSINWAEVKGAVIGTTKH